MDGIQLLLCTLDFSTIAICGLGFYNFWLKTRRQYFRHSNMSGDSAPPAKKQKLNNNNNEQQHMDNMSAGDQINCNYIKQGENEMLKQFQVLDEVNEDSNDEHKDGSDEESKGIAEEEINRMMEDGLSNHCNTVQQNPETEDYFTKTKNIQEEMLPVDWIMERHDSGMPVYMHRSTSVCTVSKPFFLGTGNVQRQNIPIDAIPCYAYRRALEEEAKQKLRDQRIDEQTRNGTCTADENSVAINNDSQRTNEMPGTAEHNEFEDSIEQEVSDDGENEVRVTNENQEERTEQANTNLGNPASLKPVEPPGGVLASPSRVETVSWQNQQLTPEQINNYCKTLFHLKTTNVLHFETPAGQQELAATDQNNIKNRVKKLYLAMTMDMNNPGYLALFHKYVRRVLHTLPTYELTQLANPSSPYQATVFIRDMKYGVGQGHSKRWAKSAAAQASLLILIPELKDELDKHAPHSAPAASEPDFTFFDSLNIEDPSSMELCHATYEPSPHAILRTCLLRNFGMGLRINIQIKKTQSQETQLIMKVAKHTATVVCKTKKIAKQRASQSILQMLHPQVRSWGSLLRMYGSRTETFREKKGEQQDIFQLQEQECRHEPNTAVLGKLQLEMRKLEEKYASGVCVGTLHLGDLPSQSASNLNLVEL